MERYDIECDRSLWKGMAEAFGNDMTVMQSDSEKVLSKFNVFRQQCVSGYWLMAASVKLLLRNISEMKFRQLLWMPIKNIGNEKSKI